MSLRLPEKIEDLNSEWFSQILGKPIRPESLKLIGNVSEGLGFLSSLVRAEFETQDGAKQALIVKLIPTDEFCRTALIEDKLDKTEIMSYQVLLPQFIREVPELGKYICEVPYSKIQVADPAKGVPYNSVLVLKDLKPEGYYVVTTDKDLHESHYRQGLDFLVKLHGASACLEKRLGSTIPTIHADWFTNGYEIIPPGDNVVFPKIYLFFPKGIPIVNPLLEKHPRLNAEVRPAMDKIAANSKQIFRAVINAGQVHPTLVHGDLWTLNMLVKDGDFPVKIIDWQLVGYTDPAFDLAIFLTYCLPFPCLPQKESLKL